MSEGQKQVVQLLKGELTARRARNARYSLRSFSKSLNISHSLLSLVLSGKRAPSKILEAKLKTSLGGSGDFDGFRDIGTESFSHIATWVHYAILGLVTLKPFSENPIWMAAKLGISPAEARAAWSDLVRLRYVKKAKGAWIQAVPPIEVKNANKIVPGRAFHRQLLAKAEASMDLTRFEQRDVTSIIFPMRLSDMPLAKEKIRKFRRNLCKELENRKGNDAEVYAMTMQLFPLTKSEGAK